MTDHVKTIEGIRAAMAGIRSLLLHHIWDDVITFKSSRGVKFLTTAFTK